MWLSLPNFYSLGMMNIEHYTAHQMFDEIPLVSGIAALYMFIVRSFPTYKQDKIYTMKKGLHPQMQWISYVTQSGRLMHVMMTKIHHVGKVYHLRARRQLAESIGQIAKFKRRYEKDIVENDESVEKAEK
ncbi:hypothetical protein SDJN02_08734, partial [Cucurbita argyrosperma subsp. argyrosperma]